jgi:hypothetical protein
MAKEALSGGRSIRALKVKIMEDGQNLQGLGRQSPRDVMPLGEIAIAALHGRGGALIVGSHPSSPLYPRLQCLRLEGEGEFSRHQCVKGLTGGLPVAMLEVRGTCFIGLLRPIQPGQEDG